MTPSPNWSATFQFPDDPFAVINYDNQQPGWIKFAILTCDPGTVYFQNSVLYPFHYDFASAEMDPFVGLTPAQFDALTLFADGQEAVLGAVLVPPMVGFAHAIPEYGIQFVRHDAYSAQDVIDLFNAVTTSIVASPEVTAYYFPTFEQQAAAEAHREVLEAAGVTVSSTARWTLGNSCYASGWALGRLRYVAAEDITAAYLAGTLQPDDILLTDGIPAELPFVSGIISLAPSTPNSHVAILAASYGVPFVHLADPHDADKALGLLDRTIVLRAYGDPIFGCAARTIDASALTQDTVDSLLDLRALPPLAIAPVAPYGASSASVAGLVPADIQYFGGKAANFGFLRRAIPAASPVATGLSFDVWTAFLDQTLGSGVTLRSHITARLSDYTYPPNMTALTADLEALRDLIKDDAQTSFDPLTRADIIAALQDPQFGFDPDLKIRFRSSTNVEDSDQFVGAGLYDSKSGCLADDLDGDTLGPSHCDPTDADERGVFRAIRRVFASFYNDNAFLERLRRGVNEADVGMAVLAHHSFPDPIELANGVATYRHGPGSFTSAYLVTQAGDVSVTNPDGSATPEEVDVYISSGGSIWPIVLQHSNLVQLGDTVLDDPDDYVALTQLLIDVATEFGNHTGLAQFVLEFEYKKMAPGGGAVPSGGLVVKQVRQLPQPDETPNIVPFLISEPTELCVFQGETGDVYGNHRVKSQWLANTRNTWLDADALDTSLFDTVSMTYAEGCQLFDIAAPLDNWPNHEHTIAGDTSTDTWFFDHLQNPRHFALQVGPIPEFVSAADSPIVVLGDFGFPYDFSNNACFFVTVDYDTPVPGWDWTGPIMTTTDYATLCTCPHPRVGDVLKSRVFIDPGVATYDISFYWPPDPGAAAGYTAPLVRWVETIITGLTTEPLVLTDTYAQTYRPEHHNFSEHFIFEPALDPGLTPEQRQELAAADIRAIHVHGGFSEALFVYYSDAEWGSTCNACFDRGDIDINGTTDLDDILCVVSAAIDVACSGADILPCTPDGTVDSTDVIGILDAFAGAKLCEPTCY